MATQPKTWKEFELLYGKKSPKPAGSIVNPRGRIPTGFESSYFDDRNRDRSFSESRLPMSTRSKFRGLLGETMLGEYGGLPLGKEELPQLRGMPEVPNLRSPMPFKDYTSDEEYQMYQDYVNKNILNDPGPPGKLRRIGKEKFSPLDVLKGLGGSAEKVFDPEEYRKSMVEKQQKGKGWAPGKGWTPEKWMAHNKYMKGLQEQQDLRRKQKPVDFLSTERAYEESLPRAAELEQMNLEKVMMDKTMKPNDSRSLLSEAVEGKEVEARQFARTFNPQSTADVKKLQGYLGLEQDGILGPQTEKALRKLQGVEYTPPIKSAKGKKGSNQKFELSLPSYEQQNQPLTVDLTGGRGTGMEFDPNLPTFEMDLRR